MSSIIDGLTESGSQGFLDDRSLEMLAEEVSRIWQLRQSGVPIAHALGKTKFLGDWFHVRPDVLVPHPATEVFVLFILAILRCLGRRPKAGIELGLGTGAIAISLLQRLPALRMIGSELSVAALDNTKLNAVKRLGGNVNRLTTELCRAPSEVLQPFVRAGVAERSLSIIVSNPPYLLPTDEISEEYRTKMPAAALYSPSTDGLAIYRELADAGSSWLAPGGVICVEARTARATHILELFKSRKYEVSCMDKAQVSEITSLDAMSPVDAARQYKNHRYIAAWLDNRD